MSGGIKADSGHRSLSDASGHEPVRDADQIEAARRIMTELLPDAGQRAVVLDQLMRSGDLANSAAPNAWAVTLFADGFRLNVGQVETLIFHDGRFLRVLLAGTAGTPPFVGERFVARHYKSVPEPQCEFFGGIEEFESSKDQIQPSHMDFIRLAATTRSGNPRAGTPHLQSHSAGLLAYAKEFLRGISGGVEAPTAEDDVASATDLPDDATEREAVIAARRGQGRFRDELLREWGGCAVTECRNGALLRASHIKPWRDSSNRERLSPDNGLLLSAHLDAAFDRGLISFSDDGCLLIHADRFSEDDAKALGIHAGLRLRWVRPGHAFNLAVHRKRHGFEQ